MDCQRQFAKMVYTITELRLFFCTKVKIRMFYERSKPNSLKITWKAAFLGDKIVGPIFLNQNRTGDIFVDLLENTSPSTEWCLTPLRPANQTLA